MTVKLKGFRMNAKESRNLVRRLVRACIRAHQKGAIIDSGGFDLDMKTVKGVEISVLEDVSYRGESSKPRVCVLGAVALDKPYTGRNYRENAANILNLNCSETDLIESGFMNYSSRWYKNGKNPHYQVGQRVKNIVEKQLGYTV